MHHNQTGISEVNLQVEKNRQYTIGLIYGLVILTLIVTVVMAAHSFITSGYKTDELLENVDTHITPAFVFFGENFFLDACGKLVLQPGSLKIDKILQKAVPCHHRVVHLVLNSSDLQEIMEKPEAFDDTDFVHYILNYVSDNIMLENDLRINRSLDISLIALEGPAAWIMKETLFARIRSPKEEFLHPFYTFMLYSRFLEKADIMQKHLNESNGMAAFQVFNKLVFAEERSYRMIPARTVSMFSMLDGITHLHSKMTHRRIRIEPTFFMDYREGLYNCDNEENQINNNVLKQSYKISSNSSNSNESICLQNITTWSESMFRWHDGTVAEHNTYKHRDLWAIVSTITTAILAFDRLISTMNRYKSNKKQHEQKILRKIESQHATANNNNSTIGFAENYKMESAFQHKDHFKKQLTITPVNL